MERVRERIWKESKRNCKKVTGEGVTRKCESNEKGM